MHRVSIPIPKNLLWITVSSNKYFICIGGAFWVLETFMVALMEVGPCHYQYSTPPLNQLSNKVKNCINPICHYQYSSPLNQLSNKVKNNCIKTFWMKKIIFQDSFRKEFVMIEVIDFNRTCFSKCHCIFDMWDQQFPRTYR